MNKEYQFNLFSKNLDHVLKAHNLAIQIEPQLEVERYICPIGFSIHSIEGLSDEFDDQLTIEHAPPKSVGGKACCLVRRDINNASGHLADKLLFEFLKGMCFKSGEAGILSKLMLGLPRLKSPRAIFIYDEKKGLQFYLKGIDLINQMDVSQLSEGFQFKFEFQIQGMNLEIKCLLLKIAYLKAFKALGYGLLFNGQGKNIQFERVREQILNPSEEKIPILFNLKKEAALDGVAIITEPIEVAAILVGFKLKFGACEFWAHVFLPAPDARGFSGIEYLKEELEGKPMVNLTYQGFGRIDLSQYKGASYFNDFWVKHRGWRVS